METLDFKFPESDFSNIPTLDFHNHQENPQKYQQSPNPTHRPIFYKEEKHEIPENLEFSLNPNKENIFTENNPIHIKQKTSQRVQFNIPFIKPVSKKLMGLKSNQSKKQHNTKNTNKFIKPFKKQSNAKEWNDDVKTIGVFQKFSTIEVNEERIKQRNDEYVKKKTNLMSTKEEKDRKKHKTYQSTQLLQDEIFKEAEHKSQFTKQVNFKKQKIKDIQSQIDNEKQKQNVIYDKFSVNMKKFQSQSKSNEKNTKNSNKKPKNSTSNKNSKNSHSDNLLEIDNYTPPKQIFPKQLSSILPNHEAFQQELLMKKQNVKYSNYVMQNQADDDIDNIPTKENGETIRSPMKIKDLTGGSYRMRPININPINESPSNKKIKEDIERNEKQRVLENMIVKHKEDMIKKNGGFIQTEYSKQINQKIDQIKNDMEPLLNVLSKKNKELSNYPFTSNLLSKACSKLVCVNSEKITEMLIDDILYELIVILNENEHKEIKEDEYDNRRNLIEDFVEAIKDLQCDQDLILNERNNFYENQNKIRDIKTDYIGLDGKIRYKDLDQKKLYKIIELSEDLANKVLKDKMALDSLINAKSLNDKKMVNKTKEASELLVKEIYEEVFEEFGKMQDEFVEKLYFQEFFQK